MSRGLNEAETCRKFVLPALSDAGWSDEQILPQLQMQNPDSEHVQAAARDGLRIADYVLAIGGVPLVVVEAKRESSDKSDGMQQALDYAQRLEAPFAVSTNGHRHVLHDRTRGVEREISRMPEPGEAWAAYEAWVAGVQGTPLDAETRAALQIPFDRSLMDDGGTKVKIPRYYQRLAVHAVIRAIGRGDQRALLLMATGSGKTFTALQLVHKLRSQAARRPDGRPYRVLYLADRDFLVSDPKSDFTEAFGDAVHRLRAADLGKSRELHFATYQTMDRTASDAEDAVPSEEAVEPSLFHALPRDFYDLVVVDECHRGSASADSSWRGILEHFSDAVQVGLTATPKRDTNVDTYDYFGDPVSEYSLRQGIEDGFLAPYRVRRAVLSVDAFGYSPSADLVDRYGREVPAGLYGTRDFERSLSLPDRTAAMARHLTGVLADDPGARAVVFCVDAEHAQQMRQALMDADPDRTRENPAWVARIVGSEPEKTRLLEEFTSPERTIPTVATTVRLLSTGIDIQDLRYVVLCRLVGSMVEFKQIIGRGTRLYPPKGKQDFWVVDYVGASEKFSDKEFDGKPLAPTTTELIGIDGEVVATEGAEVVTEAGDETEPGILEVAEPSEDFEVEPGGDLSGPPRKLYVEGVEVTIMGERVSIIDPTSGEHRMVEYRQYVGTQTRILFPDGVDALRQRWSDSELRPQVRQDLAARGVAMEDLVRFTGMEDADPFDVVAHVAWDMSPLTRRERAEGVRRHHAEKLDTLSEIAREVVDAILDRYAEQGPDEISVAALKIPPLPRHGMPMQLAGAFGGPDRLRSWLGDLQDWLYEEHTDV